MAYDETPYLIGLHGNMGVGKTYLASHLADPSSPTVSFHLPDKAQPRKEIWSHMYFAMGIKRLLNAKLQIAGEKEEDRQLYAIHEALTDILGRSPLFGSPPFEELVDLTYWIQGYPIDVEAEKHRDFMQDIGSKVRSYNHDAWVQYVEKKIELDSLRDEPLTVVLSDVRYENEAALVRKYDGMMIKLTADADTILDRLIERDGSVPSKDQLSHESEAYKPDDSEFDLILDTTDRDVVDLVAQVRQAYKNKRFSYAQEIN